MEIQMEETIASIATLVNMMATLMADDAILTSCRQENKNNLLLLISLNGYRLLFLQRNTQSIDV